jgi:hypothetical protein
MGYSETVSFCTTITDADALLFELSRLGAVAMSETVYTETLIAANPAERSLMIWRELESFLPGTDLQIEQKMSMMEEQPAKNRLVFFQQVDALEGSSTNGSGKSTRTGGVEPAAWPHFQRVQFVSLPETLARDTYLPSGEETMSKVIKIERTKVEFYHMELFIDLVPDQQKTILTGLGVVTAEKSAASLKADLDSLITTLGVAEAAMLPRPYLFELFASGATAAR